MKIFENYLSKKGSEIKLASIEKYKLKSNMTNSELNNLEFKFGHFKNFKMNKNELNNYLKFNRIIKNSNVYAKNLFLTFKEYNIENSPVLKNTNLNIKFKTLIKTYNSIMILKKSLLSKKLVKGRIVKEIKGGFIVSILGFKAFLPHSQSHVQKENNEQNFKLFYKPLLLRVLSIKIIKSNFPNPNSSNYFFNIIVSSKKTMKNLKKKSKDKNIKFLNLYSKILYFKKFKFQKI